MLPDEYGMLCDRILTETMKYINTEKMTIPVKFRDNANIQAPIYKSAVESQSPITLIYTPSGSGKSKLINDRAKALMDNGTPAQKLAVLSMNIAKAKQTAKELPGVNVMTFSDFTHGIFTANYHGYDLSDLQSIINTLKIQNLSPSGKNILDKLSMSNPKDRTSLMTIFVNNHLKETEDEFAKIHKINYAIESMICQNRIYQLPKNPYDFEEILINGVHNMPLHTLCTVLEYASMYGCRLFITGMPNETIYDFSMAYSGAMNIISAYASTKNIGIIRLQPEYMNADIQAVLAQNPSAKISSEHIHTANVNTRYMADTKNILDTIFQTGPDYINEKINKHEQILVIAKSKSDIAEIKASMKNKYLDSHPAIQVLDLTEIQPPSYDSGTLLAKYYGNIASAFPNGINRIELLGKLYDILCLEINNAGSMHMKAAYQAQKENLAEIAKTVWTPADYERHPVRQMIQQIIDQEMMSIQKYNDNIRVNACIDISAAGIILSTIHSAIDIRLDNVVLYMKNGNNKIDENLYRVALSRANMSEYLIFMNSDNFDVPVQQYIKTHMAAENKKGQ